MNLRAVSLAWDFLWFTPMGQFTLLIVCTVGVLLIADIRSRRKKKDLSNPFIWRKISKLKTEHKCGKIYSEVCPGIFLEQRVWITLCSCGLLLVAPTPVLTARALELHELTGGMVNVE